MIPEDYLIEAGPMGPIGEMESLVIRVNRNCPWNQCLFCPVYKASRFSARTADEVCRDIDSAARMYRLVENSSIAAGLAGEVNQELLGKIIRDNRALFDDKNILPGLVHALNNIANWISFGGKSVFLQDANALFMETGGLMQVLARLKEIFPSVDKISCYTRSKTLAEKSSGEMSELHDAGLTRCYVGIESGDDEVLERMKKGSCRDDHLLGMEKAMEAGINVAAFVMPGLAGDDRALSEKHVDNTVSLLNTVRPDEVRIRSLAVIKESPLYREYQNGTFIPPNEDLMIEEIRRIITGLDFDCTLETYQMTNVLFNVREKLSGIREELLRLIGEYMSLAPLERAELRLTRYIHDGYLDVVRSSGLYDEALHKSIEGAINSITRGASDELHHVEQAIFDIKSELYRDRDCAKSHDPNFIILK